VKPQVKFTPPVIKKAEEVREEEKPPPKKELEKATASTITVAGDENAKLDAPVVPDKGPAIVEAPPAPAKVEIFEFVEQMPEFPGGEDAMMAYIQKNLKYPKQAVENNIDGKVVVNFVVNESGDISDVKVMRGIKYGCDEEAMRVVRGMPNWKAGKQNGKAVKVSYSLPITFQLDNE
jgi:protein TonB